MASNSGKITSGNLKLKNTDFSKVQHLSIADHVVVLGTNGRITQQGSFEELNAVEGYVQSLSLEKQEPSAILKHDIETVPLIMPDAFINLPPADGDRRTGDMSLYTYYIQTVGIPQSIFFVGLLSLYVFFLSFPGTSTIRQPIPKCKIG